MKNLLTFIVLLLLSFRTVSAAEFIDGYIVKLNNDTLQCQIKLPETIFGKFAETSLFLKVTMKDSSGTTTTFKPEGIRGFGLVYDGMVYEFISKQTDENGEKKFVKPVFTGDKLNLYSYSFIEAGLKTSYLVDVLVLEDVSKRTVAVSNINNYKKKIKHFLEGNQTLLKFFDDRVGDFSDIKMFVAEANDMH